MGLWSGVKMATKIFFICDGFACERRCKINPDGYGYCRYTTDINHAANFRRDPKIEGEGEILLWENE